MQDIHITFPLDQFHALLAAFEVQFEAQQPEVTVLDFGSSYKQAVGYLVLEWADEVDESFIHQLTADNTIGDFCVYSIPCSTDDPFGPLGSGDRGQGELFVWDAQTWARLYSLHEPGASVYALAWSPDGAGLVTGGSDGRLTWWDLRHGERERVRKAHEGTVQALKLSPDGRLLASCGDDGAIRLWDVESGGQVRTLRRDRPYERLDITGIRGLTQAEIATLLELGAVEDSRTAPW